MENRGRVMREYRTKFDMTRASEDEKNLIIEGYFALYENETELFEGVYEVLSRGAFEGSLKNDIRALWNHDSMYVLGRNKNDTLELKSDEKGLYGVVTLPNTQYAKDLYTLIQRGDVDQCSFGFNILDETVEELADGSYRWRINKIDLHEISVVTFPAYENTSINARSKQIEQMEKRKIDAKKEALKKRMEELKK